MTVSSSGFTTATWPLARLGDVVSILRGSTLPASAARTGKYPVVAGGKSPAYYSNQFNRDGLTITVSASGASAGYVGLYSGRIFASDCSTISQSREYEIEYVYYALQAQQALIYAKQTGGAQPHIHPKDLAELEVIWPPIAEQRRIATALIAADEVVRGYQALIAKKENVKAALMSELMSGQRRLPGFSGAWTATTLGAAGKTYGGLNGKNASDFGSGEAFYIPFVNILKDTRIDNQALGRVRIATGEKQSPVLPGDVLFNGSSEVPDEVALASVFDGEVKNLYLNSFSFGYRIDRPDILLGSFLAYYMRSAAGRAVVYPLAQGSTRYNISKRSLMAASIVIPTTEEQELIAQVLTAADTELDSLRMSLDKAMMVREALQSDLLSGRRRL